MQDTDIIKQLKAHYYATIILLVLLFAFIFFRIIVFNDGETVLSDGLQRWAIAFTIAVIPLALWVFSEKLKKASRSSKELKMKEVRQNVDFAVEIQSIYRTFFLLRQYLLSATTLVNIVLFGLTRNVDRAEGHDSFMFGVNNFFWFSLLMFIVLAFCKPSEEELAKYSALPANDVETPCENTEDNIMWWEKGKEKKVPVDSVITETTFGGSQNIEEET